MSRWYRAYEGTVTDAKLHEAAMVAGVSRSVAIAAWHCLLESAAGRNNCGSFDATPRRIAVILCEKPTDIDALLAAFNELGLIGEGAVRSWKRRQFQSDDSKERVAKHRAKKRQENADVTVGNGDVTAPYTETDTDKKDSSNEELSAEPTAKPVTKNEIIEAWQTRMVPQGFPAIRKITGQRDRQLKARIRDSTIDEWSQAFSAMERSSFLRGENDRGWRADFDFLLQPKSFTKLLEGAYDQ